MIVTFLLTVICARKLSIIADILNICTELFTEITYNTSFLVISATKFEYTCYITPWYSIGSISLFFPFFFPENYYEVMNHVQLHGCTANFDKTFLVGNVKAFPFLEIFPIYSFLVMSSVQNLSSRRLVKENISCTAQKSDIPVT